MDLLGGGGTDGRRPAALVVPEALRREILAHLQAALPWEGVGLLATPEEADREERAGPEVAEAGPPVVAVRFYPGSNGAASATRYTMPPEEVLAAFVDMDAHGWRLGAIVHSHPRGPATPSPTDLREAFYPEALMAIVSFAVAPPQVRAWWVAADGRPCEVSVVGGPNDSPAGPERGTDR